MAETFDALVVGLGAFGASVLRALARRGVRALGLDRFKPPHDLGSSHGETRTTRVAVGEGDIYVPLVRRSHEVWRELEATSGVEILNQCGFLTIDTTGGASCLHGLPSFFERTVAVARRNGVAHELLDGAELRARFPAHAAPDHARGYFEREGGLVHAERAVAALLDDALRAGATVWTSTTYRGHRRSGSGFEIETDQGTVHAGRIVLAAGPWLPGLAPVLRGRTRLLRQVLHWFSSDAKGLFDTASFPAFLWLHGPEAQDCFYGVADIGSGVKLATEQYAAETRDPDTLMRSVTAEETATFVHRHVTGRIVPPLTPSRSVACLYTMTPDARFVVDRLPDDAGAFLVSACSGHGFKHAPAVGELVAAAVVEGIALPPDFALARPTLARESKETAL